MKKWFCTALSAFIVAGVVGCTPSASSSSSSSSSTEETMDEQMLEPLSADYQSLILDKNFEEGFHVNGLHATIYQDEIEKFMQEGYSLSHTSVNFQYGEKGYNTNGFAETPGSTFRWKLHQAASRYPFHDVNNTAESRSINRYDEGMLGTPTFNYRYTQLGEKEYLYENQSKTMQVNTQTGEISLLVKGSECYKSARVANQEWPHWLLLQDWGNVAGDYAYTQPRYAMKNFDSIRMRLRCKVDYFRDLMGEEANPGLHSAICMYYILLGYKSPEAAMSYDFLYLGLPVFDNRQELPDGGSFQDGNKESATDKWIMNLFGSDYYTTETNSLWKDGKVAIDKWAVVDIELYPYIERALSDAQAGDCMKNATLDDLYVVGMYLGFELPGTYDLGMTFQGIDIATRPKK